MPVELQEAPPSVEIHTEWSSVLGSLASQTVSFGPAASQGRSPPARWASTTPGLPKCSFAGPPKLGAAATLSATSPVAAAVHATRRLDIPGSLDLGIEVHFAGPGWNPAVWGVRIAFPLSKS